MQTKSLASLNEDFLRLQQLLISNGGEISEEIDKLLIVDEEMLSVKADSYAHVIERLEDEETYWKNKSDQYAKVGRSCATARQRLRDAIKNAMVFRGIIEIEGEDCSFKLTASAPKLVINQSELPPQYLIETVTVEPLKEALKLALKRGETISGAHLEPVTALRTNIKRGGK